MSGRGGDRDQCVHELVRFGRHSVLAAERLYGDASCLLYGAAVSLGQRLRDDRLGVARPAHDAGDAKGVERAWHIPCHLVCGRADGHDSKFCIVNSLAVDRGRDGPLAEHAHARRPDGVCFSVPLPEDHARLVLWPRRSGAGPQRREAQQLRVQRRVHSRRWRVARRHQPHCACLLRHPARVCEEQHGRDRAGGQHPVHIPTNSDKPNDQRI
mmetsp:Transcript_99337/g.277590  ORF Transcript_99337/g.277590 Transcript_99337/m.277590 type:complete len:212 (+) Transcript_99337:246-881(+)